MKTIFNTVGNIIGLVVVVGIGIILVLTLKRTNPQREQIPTFQSPIEKAVPAPTDTPTLTQFSSPIIPLSPTPTTLGLAIPTPKPTSTITAISVFEPIKSGGSILGITFQKPAKLTSISHTQNLILSGWVPGSTSEVIVQGKGFIDVINIKTDGAQRLLQWNPEIYSIISQPVWARKSRTLALILGNFETKQYELWINSVGSDVSKQPRLKNVESSFVPVTAGTGMAIYDNTDQSLKLISNNGSVLKTNIQPLQKTALTQSTNLNITQYKNQIAYYSHGDVLVVDSGTQKFNNIRIDYQLPIQDVQWSWNGVELALLRPDDNKHTSSHLYLYNFSSGLLRKIETPFTSHIDNIAWAPDNQHIIVSGVIGEAKYQTANGQSFSSVKNALFLVDTISLKYAPVPIVLPDIASSVGRILWSPDGYLVISYRYYDIGIVTYRVQTFINEK